MVSEKKFNEIVELLQNANIAKKDFLLKQIDETHHTLTLLDIEPFKKIRDLFKNNKTPSYTFPLSSEKF